MSDLVRLLMIGVDSGSRFPSEPDGIAVHKGDKMLKFVSLSVFSIRHYSPNGHETVIGTKFENGKFICPASTEGFTTIYPGNSEVSVHLIK